MLGLRGFIVSFDTGLSVSRLGSEEVLEEADVVAPDTDFQVLRMDLRTPVFSDEEGIEGDDGRGDRGGGAEGTSGNPLCGGGGGSPG
jgi:hypothetical protein